MPGPLLGTKLYIPRPRRGVVQRARLTERLSHVAEVKLTLVSAPAGFGKTTLLGAWLANAAAEQWSVAWLSLDEGDNDPGSFWTYLIAALRTVHPAVGADALALLQSDRPPPLEAVLGLLLNELSTIPNDVVLVLDDYHVIDARAVDSGLAFLLDHLPPCVHVVIASRTDPELPLARLRARGELIELRADDLRFTADEAAAYLNDSMRLQLTSENVDTLERRTEGWIAALQLAALSMQGRDNLTDFIAEFAGDDRYIVDYLVQEVLNRQPDHVRSFLQQTSVLDRLSGSLCDAVTGQDGGKAMLEALERNNLFLVPLDDRRRWYRYHHLFADVLRARLLDEQAACLPDLHRRASAWYERNAQPAEAIRHALAADDFPLAADLIERAVPELLRGRHEATLLAWLKALPDDVLRVRPVLSEEYAGALLANGVLEGVDARLQDAERWLYANGGPDAHAAGTVVVDQDAFRRLPGSIAMHRAALALRLGHLPDTVRDARRALDLLAADDHLGRGGAAALLGLAAWTTGDLEAAHAAYVEASTRLQQAGHVADVLGCALVLADIRIAQGRLHEALRTFERAVQLATEQGEPAPRGTADMYVGMSGLYHEQGNDDMATELLLRSQALGEHNGLPQNPYRWRVAAALVRRVRGDLAGALDLLDQAERVYNGDFSPNVRPIGALKARIWIAQGRLAEALDWARERRLSAQDDLSYVREFELITLARLLLARGAIPEAVGLLRRLEHAADDGGRVGGVIELLVLQALACSMRGDRAAALVPLSRALALAAPAGYVRVFVDEGAPLMTLLQAAANQGIAVDYVRRLVATFGATEHPPPSQQGLVESLSERELDVVRLLRTDLDGPDIARELVVSLSTLRTHTKNIYSKLGVNSRRAAVRRAEELGLLTQVAPARSPP